MNGLSYISTSALRNNLADVINDIFSKKVVYIVKKSGIPMVKLTSIDMVEKSDEFLNFAGILSDKETGGLLKKVRLGRK
ncbi:hypothetical protein KKE45_00510, partial [Patescibacteria group bacterium]|nr:hypothetical protein [Patescibacteria group bacterium]